MRVRFFHKMGKRSKEIQSILGSIQHTLLGLTYKGSLFTWVMMMMEILYLLVRHIFVCKVNGSKGLWKVYAQKHTFILHFKGKYVKRMILAGNLNDYIFVAHFSTITCHHDHHHFYHIEFRYTKKYSFYIF